MRKILETATAFTEAAFALSAAFGIYFFCRHGANFYFFSLPEYMNAYRPKLCFAASLGFDFFRFSLPDGLWLYAFLSFLRFTFSLLREGEKSVFIWYLAAIVFAVAFEIGQFFGLVAGVFDKNDLLAYLFFTLIFFRQR